jgi:biotin carboxylase
MIVGAAEEHCLGIRAAREMGLKVFVTDGNPSSIGFAEADAHAVASTYDGEATLAAARGYVGGGGRIDGVMTLAADVPYTVAFAAHHLGLPNIGLEAARNASEKMRMKERFRERGVAIPRFQELGDETDLGGAARQFGFPVVVKPVDSRGARGVQLVREAAGLDAAYAGARRYSPSGRVMVEQYLLGPQLSTEGFMLDGEAYIPAIFDRNYEFLDRFAPFIVEDGGEMPSVYAREYNDETHAVMREAALALGIRTGVVKGDLVIHDGRVKVIEIAARLSGGFFGTVATPVSCGVDLVKTNVLVALGKRVDPSTLRRRFEKAAAIRFAFPPAGRVRKVAGLDQVLADPACRYAHVFVKEGDMIAPITNHPGRPAVVVAEGASVGEAVGHARRLIAALRWEVESA